MVYQMENDNDSTLSVYFDTNHAFLFVDCGQISCGHPPKIMALNFRKERRVSQNRNALQYGLSMFPSDRANYYWPIT